MAYNSCDTDRMMKKVRILRSQIATRTIQFGNKWENIERQPERERERDMYSNVDVDLDFVNFPIFT